MGNFSFTKEPKHCCNRDCFGGNREETEKALSSALEKYKAEYLTTTIMQYIPNKYNLIKMKSNTTLSMDADYESYTYEPLVQILQDKKPPCPIWIEWYQNKNGINPKQNTYPEFKVFIYLCDTENSSNKISACILCVYKHFRW